MEVVVTTGGMSCKAPVKSSPPTNQRPVFCRPDALPVAQPTVSKHWGKKYHIQWTCLPQAHLGVFQLCLWPLTAPGYLGEVCHASPQPSDASTPIFPNLITVDFMVWVYVLRYAKIGHLMSYFSRSFKVNECDTNWSGTYDCLLVTYSDHEPILCHFWDKQW